MQTPTTPVAPWLATLPLESRGFRVPAETPWVEGIPKLSLMGVTWKAALGFLRRCAVCGYKLAPGQDVYRAFSQGDAAEIRGFETESAHDAGGPAHLSCMLYSAITCPYLKQPDARLGKASKVQPGAKRGKLAAVMGFADCAVLLPLGPHTPFSDDAPPILFLYRNLLDDIRYREGGDLRDRYLQAVVNDSPFINLKDPLKIWTNGSDPKLQEVLRKGYANATIHGAPYFTAEIVGANYGGHLLPVV